MEILSVGACPYEEEVLEIHVRFEEGEVLTEGGTIQIEMMDDSFLEREVKITPFSELCTRGKRAYKYTLQGEDKYFVIKYINRYFGSET